MIQACSEVVPAKLKSFQAPGAFTMHVRYVCGRQLFIADLDAA